MKSEASWVTPTLVFFGGGLVLLGIIALRPRAAQAMPAPQPLPGPVPSTSISLPATQLPSTRQMTPLPQIGLDPAIDQHVFAIMQQQLKSLGYRITTVDGIPGPQTWAAMTAWARDKNFPISSRGVSPDIITQIDADFGARTGAQAGTRTA